MANVVPATLWITGIAWAILGGLAYRLRGSSTWREATGFGIQTARILLYALPTGLCVASVILLLLGPAGVKQYWLIPTAVAVFCWIGSTLPQEGLSMGRDGAGNLDWRRWWQDLGGMFLRGIWWTWGASAPLVFAGAPWWAGWAGPLLYVVSYEVGWRLHGKLGLGGTEWGEKVFGAAFMAGTFGLTILTFR